MLAFILLQVDLILMAFCAGGVLRKGIRRAVLPQGKHVTRPLTRRIGFVETVALRTMMILSSVPASFTGHHVLSRTLLLVYWIWTADDIFFSDDNDEKKWDGLRVKLRKWKPVMQRLAQQWKPRAPKVPVPA